MKQIYVEKLKLYKEDSSSNQLNDKIDDEDYKDWKKPKENDQNQPISKKSNRNSKAGKNSSFYQAGKAIIFQ